jgi:hypothetical protein
VSAPERPSLPPFTEFNAVIRRPGNGIWLTPTRDGGKNTFEVSRRTLGHGSRGSIDACVTEKSKE